MMTQQPSKEYRALLRTLQGEQYRDAVLRLVVFVTGYLPTQLTRNMIERTIRALLEQFPAGYLACSAYAGHAIATESGMPQAHVNTVQLIISKIFDHLPALRSDRNAIQALAELRVLTREVRDAVHTKSDIKIEMVKQARALIRAVSHQLLTPVQAQEIVRVATKLYCNQAIESLIISEESPELRAQTTQAMQKLDALAKRSIAML